MSDTDVNQQQQQQRQPVECEANPGLINVQDLGVWLGCSVDCGAGFHLSRINMVERRGTVPRGCDSTKQSHYHTLAVVLGWFLA